MRSAVRNALSIGVVALAMPASAQITFYEHDNFVGRAFSASARVKNFGAYGFNDRASSVIVESSRWEVCEHTQFRGRCVVLRPGRYPSLTSMGLSDRVSSVRAIKQAARIEERRYAPMYDAQQSQTYGYNRRDNERIYEAEVIDVRAVTGRAGERCWVERERIVEKRGDANVPGAIFGAVLGGVLGHQIGGGRGQDIATAGGAIAGAAVGANVNRGDVASGYGQNVRRCANTNNYNHASYWDVTYRFRGQDHRAQVISPPGATLSVNEQGEPRN